MIKHILLALLLSGCSFEVNLDAVRIVDAESIYVSVDFTEDNVDIKFCEKLGLEHRMITYSARDKITTIACMD